MSTADPLLSDGPALIGMVHVGALPGTPRGGATVKDLAATAANEARLLADAGFTAILIENMHDVPYLRRDVGPEIVAAMTRVTGAVRDAVDVPLGVQILAGANEAALAVAHATGAQFIRAEGYVFASVADEGLLDAADAGPLLRARRRIGAENIRIYADIRKKHSSHAITADVSLAETARAASFFDVDGVIVTGASTADPTPVGDVQSVRDAVSCPVLVGSGVTPDSIGAMLQHAHGVIVGSWFKTDGHWANGPDPQRVRALVAAYHDAIAV